MRLADHLSDILSAIHTMHCMLGLWECPEDLLKLTNEQRHPRINQRNSSQLWKGSRLIHHNLILSGQKMLKNYQPARCGKWCFQLCRSQTHTAWNRPESAPFLLKTSRGVPLTLLVRYRRISLSAVNPGLVQYCIIECHHPFCANIFWYLTYLLFSSGGPTLHQTSQYQDSNCFQPLQGIGSCLVCWGYSLVTCLNSFNRHETNLRNLHVKRNQLGNSKISLAWRIAHRLGWNCQNQCVEGPGHIARPRGLYWISKMLVLWDNFFCQ